MCISTSVSPDVLILYERRQLTQCHHSPLQPRTVGARDVRNMETGLCPGERLQSAASHGAIECPHEVRRRCRRWDFLMESVKAGPRWRRTWASLCIHLERVVTTLEGRDELDGRKWSTCRAHGLCPRGKRERGSQSIRYGSNHLGRLAQRPWGSSGKGDVLPGE